MFGMSHILRKVTLDLVGLLLLLAFLLTLYFVVWIVRVRFVKVTHILVDNKYTQNLRFNEISLTTNKRQPPSIA